MISSTRASCCNNQELHQLSSLLSSSLSMIGAHWRGAFRDPIPSHPFTFIFCTCISDDVLAPSIWHTTRTFHKLDDKKENKDKDKDKDNERGLARPKVTKRGLSLVHFRESETNFPSWEWGQWWGWVLDRVQSDHLCEEGPGISYWGSDDGYGAFQMVR